MKAAWWVRRWPLGFLLLLVGLVSACGGNSSAQSQPEQERILVEARTVHHEQRDVTGRFSGYAYPWDTHGVGFLVGGRVASIHVQQGERVSKGRLLATIDPTDYALVEKLAQTQVDTIAPNYERVDTLVNKDVLPRSELDVLEGRYKAAKTQAEQASRQIHHTRLIAPVSGVVHELPTAVGQVIGQGSPAVILLQLDKLKVKFGVTQQELGHFRMGDSFDIRFDGIAEALVGKIIHIDYVADPMTRTFNIVLEIDNPDHRVRPGMLGHINVVRRRMEGFFVPIGSVIRDTEGNYLLKIVAPDTHQVQARTVTVGERLGEDLQILSGLEGGEKVITKGSNIAAIGDRVEIR